MSVDLQEALNEILDEGLDDWVPVDRTITYAWESSSEMSKPFQVIATEIIARLIEPKLMIPGIIENTGFEPWTGSSDTFFRRIIAECESFDWSPMGDGCWLANTEKGNRVARENRERES